MATDLRLTSAAFDAGDAIPERHTCTGDGSSPPLQWTGVPDGTRSLALVADDADAADKAFVHWVLFNLPPDTTLLPAGVDVAAHFDDEAAPVEGVNDFGDTGYGAPCPPPGDDPHRYAFRLYALDTTLDLGTGATKQQFVDAVDGHVLARADLMGTFARG